MNCVVEMNSVDVIFYINLASREDRKTHFLEQIKALTDDMSKVVRIEAIYDPMGALGCTKSHIKALETFMENPAWKTCIVFEDDFTFYDSSQTTNNSLLHKFFINFDTWDMLLLSSNQKSKPTLTDIPGIEKVFSSQTTSGYLTHKDVAQKIIDNFKEGAELLANSGNKPMYALDIFWNKLGLVRYAFLPNMGYQYACVSDIEQKFVDYGC
jgi:GR25 family glycosyltransferase involved in LPS biosynthesis